MLEIVLRKEKSHRSEPSLSLAVAFTGAPAFRTGPAGIDRRHGDQPAAVPGQLVFQLTPQFTQPWSRIDRFRPDLARTLLPGLCMLPAAELDRLLTPRSSTHTIAWFLLIAVEALCR